MKAKTKFTKLWSILLALAMVVGMLPTIALAAGSATATADFVSDPTTALALLNAAKTGTTDSTWDSTTKTLTLGGVNFETTAVDAVHLPGGTTIVLTGVNTITGGPAVTDLNGGWCCGIRVEGDLTISGTGSLTVIGGDASATYGVSAGIFSHVNDKKQGSTVRITGGTVETKGGPAREDSYGILAGWTGYGNVDISGNANVTATGGDMVRDNDGQSDGMNVRVKASGGGNLTISGNANVTAKAGNKGLYGSGLTSNAVSVSDNARLTAEGGKSGRSYGIYSSDTVNISGNAQVTATGKEAHYSAGISGGGGISSSYTYRVNISDNAQVTATGGNAGDQSYGINVYDLNITGGVVTATAGAVTYVPEHYWTYSSGNAGIYSSNEVNITGGVVTAMAAPVYGKNGNVDATDSRGGINRSVNISGGIVTAAGYSNDCSAMFQDAGGYKNSFDANGGTGMMSFTKATAGEYVGYALPANGFIAPVGMKFQAWEVGGTQKAVGDTITIGETTAVKALWEYINYNVGVTNGTASAGGNTITTAIINKEVTLTAAAIPGKVFDHWVVDSESASITLTDPNSATTTFTMPAGDVSVKAEYIDVISSVDITDITAPVSNTALDTTAACATAGISTTAPTVTWAPSATNADYGTTYTASVTLTAVTGYIFADADEVAATVNGETATGVTKNEDGTLTVTYAFPKTADKILIPRVDITGVVAPVPGKYLVFSASCETTGVSSGTSVGGWSPSHYQAQYGTTYTVKVYVWADDDHKFDDSTTATINGNLAVITDRAGEYWLEVSYSFTTAKHDIQISFDNTVSDGDPVVPPTINEGYEFSSWMFYEDTNKDGDFTNDNTIILDEATLEAIAEDVGMTPEALIAHYYDNYGFTIKTTFTGGYKYGLYAYIKRSDGKDFVVVDDDTVTDAIVKVNGVDKTDQCTSDGYIQIEPGVCVFTVPAPTYTVSFNASGGTGTMTDATGVLGDYTLPENGFTAPEGKQFKGWSVDGNEKAVGDKITVTADTTVKAVWENIPVTTYTVSFDANGGSGTMADVTSIFGEYTLPENGFTAPEGKQFKSWSVDGKEKAVGDKITVTADTTVTAVWETIPAAPADYDILNGANSKWTQDSDGNISVRGSGEFSKFVGVKVDGKSVDEKYYTVKEGSTIVTLKPEYLNTLTAGKHTLEIVWTDGTADTTFTVDAKPANTDTKSPQTGDSSSIALWIALLFVSAAGVLSTAVFGKKKKYQAE